jgi:hypothetical protein
VRRPAAGARRGSGSLSTRGHQKLNAHSEFEIVPVRRLASVPAVGSRPARLTIEARQPGGGSVSCGMADDDSPSKGVGEPAGDFMDDPTDRLELPASEPTPPAQMWCRCTADDHPNHPDGACAAAVFDDGFCLDCYGFVHGTT